MKDDNLGLGAKYGAAQEHGQATGLDMFQDILGRLNGKSTTILAEEQRKRSDLRSSAYIGQRWGSLRFVSGGYLVGDDLREGAKKRNYEIGPSQPAASLTPENDRQPEVNKQATAPLDSSGRRSNRKSNSCGDSRPHTGFRNGLDSILMRNPSPGSFPPEQNLSSDTLIADVGDDQRTLDKARRRAQKAERKLERRRRKDASIQEQNLPDPAQLGADIKEEIAAPHSVVGSTRSKKVLGGHGGSRNAVRQRYIQQKKMALMNNKALNEVGLSIAFPGSAFL